MNSQVIVVGGGPVGLTLALGLAHHGVRSIVLERNALPDPNARAVVIWPRSIELLRDWDAWEPLCAAGRFSQTFALHNAATEVPFLSIRFDAIDDVFAEPGYLLIPQYVTEAVLRKLVHENPLCELRTGVEVTAAEQDENGITVRAVDAESGEESLNAAFAVGCDGALSLVRDAMGVPLEGMIFKSRVVISDEWLDDPELPSPRMALDAPKLLFASRYAPSRWRVLAIVGKTVDDASAVSDEMHAQRLRALFGERAARTKTIQRTLFSVHRRHAAHFGAGRILLAGDAAHLSGPAGGQGMNNGIQDAANLAWKLAAIFAGGDQKALLESYDAERREIVGEDAVERFTERLTRLGTGFSRRLSRLGIGLLSRSVRAYGMQCKLSRALGMLNGRYTKSSLIDASHPVAGRRIGDLVLSDGRRINEVRNGQAALVTIGDADAGTTEVIRLASAPKRWHIKAPAVLIVRPDGCVAAVVEKPTPQKIVAGWQRAFAGGIPFPTRERVPV